MVFCLCGVVVFFFFSSAFNSSSLMEEKGGEKRTKPSPVPFVLDVVCSETNGNTDIKKRL